MNTLLVNQKKIDQDYDGELTINKLLDQLLAENFSNDDLITEVLLDGSHVPEDKELLLLDSKIRNYQKIEFTIKPRIQLAFEALQSCNKHIDIIIGKIGLITAAYQRGEENTANAEFATTVEFIDLFIQLMTKVLQTIKTKCEINKDTEKKLQALEIHLFSVLKSLIPAKEKKDTIMLCDLLEYELVDNLTQWKISIIPDLKNLNKS